MKVVNDFFVVDYFHLFPHCLLLQCFSKETRQNGWTPFFLQTKRIL